MNLGYFDLEQKTLQPLDHLFGTKLSPMSWVFQRTNIESYGPDYGIGDSTCLLRAGGAVLNRRSPRRLVEIGLTAKK
jgi:hypothetical protein